MTNVEKLKKCPSVDYAVREYIKSDDERVTEKVVENRINSSSFKTLFRMYLEWEGIYGYTENILNFFEVFVADLITGGSNNE